MLCIPAAIMSPHHPVSQLTIASFLAIEPETMPEGKVWMTFSSYPSRSQTNHPMPFADLRLKTIV